MTLLMLVHLGAAAAPDTDAQGSADAAAMDGTPDTPAGPPPAAELVPDIAHGIGLRLRCPVCQGLSASDSTSPAARAMQSRITELVAAGYDEEQIKDFFVERYGEWILLEPTRRGMNQALWLLPWVGAGLGLGAAAWTLVGWGRRREQEGAPPTDPIEARPRDKYEQVLLDQLKDDA